MPSAQQHAGENHRGGIEGAQNSGPLFLKSGIDDDLRRVLQPRHKLYAMAEHAWSFQDGWSLSEHRSFWAALLPWWPQQNGQRSLQETLAWWTFVLRKEGGSKEETAERLGYSLETLRRYGSFERGEEIYRQQVEEPVNLGWRYKDGTEGSPPPLPRVFRSNEDEPPHSYVNLPLASLANVRPPSALAVEQRGWKALAEIRARPSTNLDR